MSLQLTSFLSHMFPHILDCGGSSCITDMRNSVRIGSAVETKRSCEALVPPMDGARRALARQPPTAIWQAGRAQSAGQEVARAAEQRPPTRRQAEVEQPHRMKLKHRALNVAVEFSPSVRHLRTILHLAPLPFAKNPGRTKVTTRRQHAGA